MRLGQQEELQIRYRDALPALSVQPLQEKRWQGQ